MTNSDAQPLKDLQAAAAAARAALGLKRLPVVVRSHATAFSIADGTRGHAVILGEGAFWVVCLADAERLANAGYEWADR